jgi:DNA invertase Pin-like site-specific DNA recombinase
MQARGYIRISTDEQTREGGSLVPQEARLRAYCTTAGGYDEPL